MLCELVTEYFDLRRDHSGRVAVGPQSRDRLGARFTVQPLDDEALALAPGSRLPLEVVRRAERRERLPHHPIALGGGARRPGPSAGNVLFDLFGFAGSLPDDARTPPGPAP